MTRTLAEIDALFFAPKALPEPVTWAEDGGKATLTASLLQDGIVIGALSLRLSTPLLNSPQRGDAVLVLDDRPVQRMAFNPKNPHTNPAFHPVPLALRRLTLPPGRTRLYRWADNRQWPRQEGENILAAMALDPEPSGFDEALSLFLRSCAIEGVLPAAPWRPTLL